MLCSGGIVQGESQELSEEGMLHRGPGSGSVNGDWGRSYAIRADWEPCHRLHENL